MHDYALNLTQFSSLINKLNFLKERERKRETETPIFITINLIMIRVIIAVIFNLKFQQILDILKIKGENRVLGECNLTC